MLASLSGLVSPTLSVAATPYVNAVLADNPSAYWRLDETSGSTAGDLSGNGHTAHLFGVSGGAVGALRNDSDTAFSFNGDADLVDSKSLTVGSHFSIEAWLKASDNSGDGVAVSLVSGSGSARTLYVESNRFRGMVDHSDNWPSSSVYSATLDTSVWHHVVFVTDGTTLTLYVDGQPSGGARALSGAPGGFTANARVGWTWSTWMPHFRGSIDEVAVYPAALSASQVHAHYAASLPGATTASVSCSGSLQSLVDAAASGATVTVPGCVYRETVTIDKPLTLAGQPGAEIRGSDVWSAFTHSGSTFVSQHTVPSLPAVSQDSNACSDSTNRCLWPEQVFFDGKELHQVATGSTPRSGQFALDGSRHVVLADNPSGHTVEVTTRPRWIITQADGVTIQGINMHHAANSAVHGAISNDGHSNWTLQNSIAAYAHAANVSLDGGSNVKVLDNDIAFGGLDGVAGSGITQGGLVQGNTIRGNRTAEADFSQNWGAAGLKLTYVQTFTVDSNEVASNNGVGLWCDIGCSGVTISNNRVHHNAWQGINFEVSDGASIHNNTLWENGWGKPYWGWGAGIVISSSGNAQVYSNILAWNYAGISVIAQNRPDAVKSTGHSVHDNTIAKKIVAGDFSATYWKNLSLAWLSDSTATQYLYNSGSNNRAANNHFWYDQPEGQAIRFAWKDNYSSLSHFVATPGGAGSSYISTSQMTSTLKANEIPTSPEAH